MSLRAPTAWLLRLMVLLLPGCISTYAPATPVAPLLDEAGDLALGGGVRPLQPTQGGSVFVAAAPTASTRLFASGTFARQHGGEYAEYEGRTMHEGNRTNQVEVGGGYGLARRWMRFEALTGAAYGRTASKQCDWDIPMFTEYPDECPLWVDSRSWFVRPFVQAHFAAQVGAWQGGGGVRVAVARYQLEELFAQPSDRVLSLTTLEPFMVQRVGFD